MTVDALKEFLETLALIGTELRRPSMLPAHQPAQSELARPSILDLMGA